MSIPFLNLKAQHQALKSEILAAVSDNEAREAAVITFLVTASGLSFFGVSGAFWGLLAGGALLAWTRWRRPAPSVSPATAAAPGRSAGH